MDSGLIITKATQSDKPQLLALLEEAMAENLTLEQRAKQGFIQGSFDSQLLTRFISELGVYTIRHTHQIVGAAFTSRIDTSIQGPIKKATDTVFKLYSDLSTNDVFLYGPVVINAQFKGKGLLTQLLLSICSEMSKNFSKGLAFVNSDNKRSLAIHLHYFEKETATFFYLNRKYYAFLFDPKRLLQRYKNA